jgi:hypothetical protein
LVQSIGVLIDHGMTEAIDNSNFINFLNLEVFSKTSKMKSQPFSHNLTAYVICQTQFSDALNITGASHDYQMPAKGRLLPLMCSRRLIQLRGLRSDGKDRIKPIGFIPFLF